EQGLAAQAVKVLDQSNRIHANRQTTQLLFDAAEQIGDRSLASICARTLQNPNLPSEFPIQTLTPEQFVSIGPRHPVAAHPTNSMETATQPFGRVASGRVAPQPAATEAETGWFDLFRR
ncbi:MAG: hypothetical protein AAF989_12390, partial [Planctomycetota bacterium]